MQNEKLIWSFYIFVIENIIFYLPLQKKKKNKFQFQSACFFLHKWNEARFSQSAHLSGIEGNNKSALTLFFYGGHWL
jgi:hypothetical protein